MPGSVAIDVPTQLVRDLARGLAGAGVVTVP